MSGNLIEKIKSYPFWAILAVSLIARLVFFLIYLSSPEWNQLLVDSLFHDRWAASLAAGNWLGEEPFFRAPLYIYLLGLLYAIFGHSLLIARIFGHLIGLLSIYMTYRLAQRLFSTRAALLAGLLHALYPIAIYFESELLIESFFTLLIEWLTLSLFRATDHNNWKRYLPVGLIFGLAAITRPVILPLLPVLILWVFWSKREWKRAAVHSLIIVAMAVLVMLPVALRNTLVGHDSTLIASSGGINFYIGNNSAADGLSATMPPPLGASWQLRDIRYLAEKETGRSLKDSQLSDFWYRKGVGWILSHHCEFLKLYIKKLYFCFNNFEVSNNRNLPLFFQSNPVLHSLPLNFALMFSLTGIFLFLTGLRRLFSRQMFFILIFIVSYFLLISLFFINARFRLPVVPLFIIFSGAALAEIWALVNKLKQNWRSLVAAVLIGMVIYSFATSNWYRIDRANLDSGLYNEANYYFAQRDFDKTIELYHQVLKNDPSYPEANLNLGAVFLRKGVGDSAEYYLQREILSFPSSARGYSNLASLYYLRNSLDTAAQYAARAISLTSYLPEAYLVMLRIQAARNDTADFRRTLTRARENLGDEPRLLLEAGIIYSQLGMLQLAEEYLKMALVAKPAAAETDDDAFTYGSGSELPYIRAQAAYQLGYLYGIQNRLDLSIEMSRQAVAIDSSLVEAYVNLVQGYLLQGKRESAHAIIAAARKKFPNNELIKTVEEKLK